MTATQYTIYEQPQSPDDTPAELVKAKFMKLDSEHIRFVLDCMRES